MALRKWITQLLMWLRRSPHASTCNNTFQSVSHVARFYFSPCHNHILPSSALWTLLPQKRLVVQDGAETYFSRLQVRQHLQNCDMLLPRGSRRRQMTTTCLRSSEKTNEACGMACVHSFVRHISMSTRSNLVDHLRSLYSDNTLKSIHQSLHVLLRVF